MATTLESFVTIMITQTCPRGNALNPEFLDS